MSVSWRKFVIIVGVVDEERVVFGSELGGGEELVDMCVWCWVFFGVIVVVMLVGVVCVVCVWVGMFGMFDESNYLVVGFEWW